MEEDKENPVIPKQDVVPPPYSLVPTGRPQHNLGIHKLSYLDEVIIKQSADRLATRSAVTAVDGALIFNVKEHATLAEIELGGQERAFNMGLYDENDQMGVTFERGVKIFKKKKVKVYMGTELVSIVRLRRSVFGRLVQINDAENKTVLLAFGPLTSWTSYKFKLFTVQKQRIGSIKRQWRGLGNELLNSLEYYQLLFPRDLDVRYKTALIAACILIDVHYYSSYVRDMF